MIAIEYILDVARVLEQGRPLDVRRANFTAGPPRNVTPYQQPVRDNVMPRSGRPAGGAAATGTPRRHCRIQRHQPGAKRGLALTPVKFGISFNVTHFNQAGALVHVHRRLHPGQPRRHRDGPGPEHQGRAGGGARAGRGLWPRAGHRHRHRKVANTSATAASTGTDLNGKAAQDAARQIRERLAACEAAERARRPRPGEVRFANGQVTVAGKTIPFAEVVGGPTGPHQLWSDGFTPRPVWGPRKCRAGRPSYFAYGGAVSEVVVGHADRRMEALRADVLHDVGARSTRP